MLQLIAALFAMLVIGPTHALAQAYPNKPVELIVPFPAGGRSDMVARQWARVAGTHLGQQVVVVYKAGDFGAAGSTYVMNASPDGYTLLFTNIGNQILRPMSGTVPYHYDSFASIGQIGVTGLVLVARSDRPWKDLKDVAEDARQRPGAITFGTPLKLMPHLTVARFAEAAGIDLKHVTYEGDAPAVKATLEGRVDLAIAAIGIVLDPIRSSKLRPLGLFAGRRDPALGSVPTATEQGFSYGFASVADPLRSRTAGASAVRAVVGEPWAGIVAPKGTAADVLATLRVVFAMTVKDPEFVRSMVQRGERVMPLGAEMFEKRWKQDFDALEPLITEIK